MSDEIILYDLPSRGKPACWSLNPWKTRAALNYKQLPYKTEWIEYPDVEPKFKALGIPANDPETNAIAYSIPAVRLPDGRYIMDSRAIADGLEELKPEPSLHLDSALLKRTQDAVAALLPSLAPNAMPLVPEKILNPSSAEYFRRTRAARFGMPLQELLNSDKAGENAWKNAEPSIDKLRKLLAENGGPFVGGKQVTYADFVLGGLWVFMKKLDEQGLFDRLLASDKAFVEHCNAVKPWFERESY